MGFIYRIVSPTGKVYIGQTVNWNSRQKAYLNLKCKGQPKIYKSLLEYGPDNHQFDLIETCPDKEMYRREKYWIDFYNSFEKGLNACEGGESDWVSKLTAGREEYIYEPKPWFKIVKGEDLFIKLLILAGTLQIIKLKIHLCHSRKAKEVDLKELKIKLQESYEKYTQALSKETKIELSVPSTKFTRGNLQSFLTSWSNSVNLLYQSFDLSIPQLTLAKIA